ncbi:hypothetical protein [uncultured Shewanella sp.]|uniref:hypothetical protein n=1 Tax=uncultured Shewanella sp. TaxID=173975 RepID=UPI00261BC8BE|nr:hypothetical protein [uncultured Shewanella sp.]
MRIFPRAVIALMLLFPSMSGFAKSDTQAQQKSRSQKPNHLDFHAHKANRIHSSPVYKNNQYVYNRAYFYHRNHHRYYHPPYRGDVDWSIGSGWNYDWNYGRYASSWGAWWGDSWNRAAYYSFSVFYPFGWSRPLARTSQPKVTAPPQQITTSVQYSQGLTRLPDNAKVIQTNKGTQYEWQGVYYQYDWRTQTYRQVK